MEYLTDCSRYEVGYLKQSAVYIDAFFHSFLYFISQSVLDSFARWLLYLFQCVFEVDKEKGLVLKEIAENEDIPSIVGATNCEFVVRIYRDHNDI